MEDRAGMSLGSSHQLSVPYTGVKFDVLELYEDHHFLQAAQHHSILQGGLDTGIDVNVGSAPPSQGEKDAM